MRINAEYTNVAISYQKQEIKVKSQEKSPEGYKNMETEMEMVSLRYEKMTYSLSSLGYGKSEAGLTLMPAHDEASDGIKPDVTQWEEMMESIESQIKDFIEKIEELISGQAEKTYEDKLEQLRKEAAESIEDGEEWGADTVASRILDFARSISGNDFSKVDLLKNAVEEGFSFVRDKFDGELPEVSERTYDLVMDGFEEWEAENTVEKEDDSSL